MYVCMYIHVYVYVLYVTMHDYDTCTCMYIHVHVLCALYAYIIIHSFTCTMYTLISYHVGPCCHRNVTLANPVTTTKLLSMRPSELLCVEPWRTTSVQTNSCQWWVGLAVGGASGGWSHGEGQLLSLVVVGGASGGWGHGKQWAMHDGGATYVGGRG